ncbi:MAG: metal ABC transporter substrate-binding protein [Intrasporangium sp.]|uniref:metal ABC transporter substrate-binding protein n=1 Tax=Intrasporangium sp. TaxID=1925024 RepID=UPI003F7E5CFB
MSPRRLVAVAALALSGMLALASCASSSDAIGTRSTASGHLTIATSFYPLEFAVEQIAGPQASVTTLTKPGAEPHDVELSAKQVVGLRKADLLVYESGFQAAVDDAMGLLDTSKVLDVTPVADLTLGGAEDDQSHAAGDGHDHAVDPHFWLDPERYATVAEAIGERLAEVDPAHAADYTARTKAFVDRLSALDDRYRSGLAHCRIKNLVTSHAAFGYLSQRYGLVQHGITGLSPETEPSAAALAGIADLVKQHGVTTVYQETLVEPHFAQVIASETGARVATLDPVEGITSASAGKDYFEVMQANLVALEKGQDCT